MAYAFRGGIFLKKPFIIAAIVAAAGGCALHFLYDILPGVLTALISPVNESVWEHLKLLFWPSVLAAFVLSQTLPRPERLWSAFFIALLAMPVFLLGVYYLLRCGFGVEALFVDIGLYFATMFLGFFLAWLLYTRRRPEKVGEFLLLPLLLYAACLILFSFAAPPFEIFEASQPVSSRFFREFVKNQIFLVDFSPLLRL